jgi:putative peptide zinc metalloprotease protein
MSARNNDDFPLPALLPFLKLYRAPDDAETGEPVWTLHNPAANNYFRLHWAEFECLSRFSAHRTARDLKQTVENETTLSIEISDLANLVRFLQENGLTDLQNQPVLPKTPKPQSIWKKILSSYLYFMLPLWKPQDFLTRTLPYIRPFLSQNAFRISLGLFAIALILTLQRADEFFHTFTDLFSLEGAAQIALTFAVIKIVHEFAHAYTAVKHGIAVPHMGIAMIVLYPVLYTETTGSWRLSSRQDRFDIGFAGIRAEIMLASIALLLWNVFPSGSLGQSLTFLMVTVSLVGSLLVNLNPLMRFDGYYMLSDAAGIDNLQACSITFARWNLRRALFGLTDPEPEDALPDRKRFLILFGSALLIYRFFLFLGIAVAVYYIFGKPLGVFLMLVELWVFLALPALHEIRIWMARRQDIQKSRRGKITASLTAALLLIAALPLDRTISLPAIAYAAQYTAIYPSAPSALTDIFIQNGDEVLKGDVLLVLSSPALEKEYALARQHLETLESLKRGVQAAPSPDQNALASLDEEISTARKKIAALEEQKDHLIVTAPFDGVIRDMDPHLHAGRGLQPSDLLLRLTGKTDAAFSAYVSESDLDRISPGDAAVFISGRSPLSSLPLRVSSVSFANAETIDWPELSSCHGGSLQSACPGAQAGAITPIQGLYRVDFTRDSESASAPAQVMVGQIHVRGDYASPLGSFFRKLVGTLLRESGLS